MDKAMTKDTAMTKGERDDLLRLVRSREKVLKTSAGQRAAEMLAEFERQVSAIYHYNNEEAWAKVKKEVDTFVAEANKKVQARAQELGIAKEFMPEIAVGWYSRGESAVENRRNELRLKAKAEIAAIEESARAQIEMMSVNAQTEILSHGLGTDAARDFLKNLPTVEKLMPMIDTKAIESKVAEKRKDRMLQ